MYDFHALRIFIDKITLLTTFIDITYINPVCFLMPHGFWRVPAQLRSAQRICPLTRILRLSDHPNPEMSLRNTFWNRTHFLWLKDKSNGHTIWHKFLRSLQQISWVHPACQTPIDQIFFDMPTVMHCVALLWSVLHCSVSNCTKSCCTALCCTVL